MKALEIAMTAHGWRTVDFWAWGWAAGLDAGKMHAVEAALASGGVDALSDLVLARAAVGSLEIEDLDELVAFVDEHAQLARIAV